MGPQFHESGYGRTFFQAQLPNLIKAINRLADAMEKQNELKDNIIKDLKNKISNYERGLLCQK